MTSLAETYEENVGEVGNKRRLYLGVGLFATGALLVVTGMLTATIGVDLLAGFGVKWYHAREIAGVLAGLGVPAVFVGVFTILPASERVRAAAAIGAGIAVLGVALFTNAYPYDWAGAGDSRAQTLQVVAVYFCGLIVTFWCLFVAVANFKTRNDPGGTVTLEINKEGEVRTVEVDADDLDDFDNLDELRAMQTELAAPGEYSDDSERKPTGYGGVGFLGDVPMDDAPGGTHADGGTVAANDISSPLDDPNAEGLSNQRTTDTYCGNCKHFQYVRSGNGMQPHCGFYGRAMDDMDACDEWEPNS
ncbi:DUF7139 domain-containing protein [Halorussus halophilus]|uniref:DUF7139 domain-containing protein n=1 Tax=Halorussus halophilus TaxID=2650975 RepID=UPI0013019211|nr:hypothetical protein [Halorussus halophilus]